jgi:metallo-beta-lactamase family protein
MIMAAFAVGRAQQLIYLLDVLKKAGRIPDLPIFLDSPMACDASEIYHQHREDHDLSELQLDPARTVLAGRQVQLCRTAEESKAVNQINGPAVIISSSGMMTGGRILHHLKQRLPSSRNTIVLGGFQASGTRGRSLANGAKFLRIHGQDVPVRAAVESVPGLSGHADRGELSRWLSGLANPKRVMLVHGEPESSDALATALRKERHWKVDTPELGESMELA